VSLFLVDDTDGRILVELGRGGGSLAGFESSTTLRVLP